MEKIDEKATILGEVFRLLDIEVRRTYNKKNKNKKDKNKGDKKRYLIREDNRYKRNYFDLYFLDLTI